VIDLPKVNKMLKTLAEMEKTADMQTFVSRIVSVLDEVRPAEKTFVRSQMAGLLPVYGSWAASLDEQPYVQRVSLAGRRLRFHGARLFVYFLIDSGYLRLLANRCRREWGVAWDNEWIIRRFLCVYYSCKDSDL